MPTERIPTTVDGRIAMIASASALITATPATYGLTAADAAYLAALVTAVQTARATQENYRTAKAASTVALQTAVANLTSTFRALARGLRANSAIADQDLATLAVARRTPPTPGVAPGDAPVVTLESRTAGAAHIRLRQPGGSRARPTGCIGAEISLVNGVPPPVVGEADHGSKRFSSRGKATVATDTAAPRLRLYARWLTPKGAYSPWSLALAFTPQT